jgi:cobalt-zinc-cadmium efflux system outer membrane protein
MKRIFLCAFSFICFSSPIAWSESRVIKFDELLKEALIQSPEAAKIDATLAERVAEAFAAGVKPNPELSSSFDIPSTRRDGEKSEISITLSQAIRPSDLGQRGVLADVIRRTADIDQEIALNQFVQSLEVLYARAWQYQEIKALLHDARKRSSQFLGKASEGAKRGIFSEGDVELFRAEQKTFEADSVAAHGEFSQSAAELTRLSGVSVSGKELKRIDDTLSLSKDEITRLARESDLPAQRRVELLRALAETQLEVARLDSFPAISPLVGYSRHDDGIDQFTVGFSVPLPFFNRNQGERIKAQGALSAARQAERYATSDAIAKEVEFVYEAFQSLRKQAELYETAVIPSKRKALDAYYRQFEAGIGSAFPLWQAFRELNASQLRAIELRASLASAQAQLEALIGNPL